MRCLIGCFAAVVICTSLPAQTLTLKLTRLSNDPLTFANVDYDVQAIQGGVAPNRPNFKPLGLTGTNKDTALIPIPNNDQDPLLITVQIAGYGEVQLEPLRGKTDHRVTMILRNTITQAFSVERNIEVERRVLGDGTLRVHLAGSASTAFDRSTNQLEVLRPADSTDPRYSVYRSDRGGKWAFSKTVHVKCVMVRGKPCWVTLGVPVWRTDPTQQKWIFRGYLKELHSSITVETFYETKTVHKSVFD